MIADVSTRVLLHHARVVATFDADMRELHDADVLLRGRLVEAVGPSGSLASLIGDAPVERVDVSGCAVVPGFVNTHHHMFQSLTRAFPGAQDAPLFDWLSALYPVWQGLTPEMIEVSTVVAMAELLLSGCTTTSDHLYLYPNGIRIEDQIAAAQQIGMRFHACRGAMSVGRSAGGLPPDALIEREADILADMQRVVERWHDPSAGAMLRVALAPCSPFSVSQDLMREVAALARSCGVRMHTHLAEDDTDVAYTRERFGCTPAQYAQSVGWVGDDVWHAHCVKLDAGGIALFGRSGTGVAHCPCSNMRLASGVAPIPAMRAAGVPVGIGVDGSASNDGASMIGEARQAMLLARVGFGARAMSARDALELACAGGARVLGRDDIGRIAPGMCADLAVFDLSLPQFAGALHDPVAALVLCAPVGTRHTIVDGRFVVREGRLTTVEIGSWLRRHNALAMRLAGTD